jgi:hypothetical protein
MLSSFHSFRKLLPLLVIAAIRIRPSQAQEQKEIPAAFGPYINLKEQDFAGASTFKSTDRLVGTYYFYWYCVETPSIAKRDGGKFYENNWLKFLDQPSNFVMIETWSEFHEGTEICETKEYGRQSRIPWINTDLNRRKRRSRRRMKGQKDTSAKLQSRGAPDSVSGVLVAFTKAKRRTIRSRALLDYAAVRAARASSAVPVFSRK